MMKLVCINEIWAPKSFMLMATTLETLKWIEQKGKPSANTNRSEEYKMKIRREDVSRMHTMSQGRKKLLVDEHKDGVTGVLCLQLVLTDETQSPVLWIHLTHSGDVIGLSGNRHLGNT
jgi:hypothetical protein